VDQFLAYSRDLVIPIADVSPFMVDLLDHASDRGGTVHPNDDGHPVANGYAAYAEAARPLVTRP
jgi:hypothetical protein